MSNVPAIELNDGNRIPQLGFGVFQILPDQTAAAVKEALDIGYRHIDTAEMYGNEKEVGQGIRDAGVDRSEVFVTSKLNNGYHKLDDARRAFDETLKALGSDYVDLFLIHWPLPTLYGGDFVSTWKVFEEFARDGAPAASGSRISSRHTWIGSPPRPARFRRSIRSRCTRTSPTRTSEPTGSRTASPPRRGRRSLRARCSATR